MKGQHKDNYFKLYLIFIIRVLPQEENWGGGGGGQRNHQLLSTHHDVPASPPGSRAGHI